MKEGYIFVMAFAFSKRYLKCGEGVCGGVGKVGEGGGGGLRLQCNAGNNGEPIDRPVAKDVRAHDGNSKVQEEKKWVVAFVFAAVQTRRHHH